MTEIKMFDWTALGQKLDDLAPAIGMDYSERRKMVNPFMCIVFKKMVIDITKFGDWMESRYPEYLNKSIEQFLLDKDPDHLQDWKDLLGVETP